MGLLSDTSSVMDMPVAGPSVRLETMTEFPELVAPTKPSATVLNAEASLEAELAGYFSERTDGPNWNHTQ